MSCFNGINVCTAGRDLSRVLGNLSATMLSRRPEAVVGPCLLSTEGFHRRRVCDEANECKPHRRFPLSGSGKGFGGTQQGFPFPEGFKREEGRGIDGKETPFAGFRGLSGRDGTCRAKEAAPAVGGSLRYCRRPCRYRKIRTRARMPVLRERSAFGAHRGSMRRRDGP